MKHYRIILASVFLFVFILSCKNEPKTEIKTVETSVETTKHLDPDATYSKAEFNIKGMTCEIGCAKTIQKKLSNMEGVKSAKVDFKNEMAMVEYNVAKANPMSISKTVTSVSDTYSVDNMKTVIEFTEYKKDCSKKCKEECCKDKTNAAKKSCAKSKACEKKCKKKCSSKKA